MTASLLAVQAHIATVKHELQTLIQSVKSPPSELLSLQNELSGAQTLLRDMNDFDFQEGFVNNGASSFQKLR